MSLKLNSSGGGSVTLQEPVTASDLTLNLPATLGGTGNSMVVTSNASGNVGIGTGTPGATLDVNGSIRGIGINAAASGGEGGEVAFNNPDNASTGLTIDVGTADVGRIFQVRNNSRMLLGQLIGTGGTVEFFTSQAERARIDSSGNLLVGATTKYSAGLPGNVVQINGGNNGGLVIGNGTSNIAMYRDLVNNITYWFNGSNQASLTASGAWTNASDAKLKKEITTIKYGLDTVLSTQPRSYKRVDVEGEYIGFVAQELKEQIPEVVFGSDTVQYSVDYGSLVAVAFKAIQELKAELDTVKAELAAMKGTA